MHKELFEQYMYSELTIYTLRSSCENSVALSGSVFEQLSLDSKRIYFNGFKSSRTDSKFQHSPDYLCKSNKIISK